MPDPHADAPGEPSAAHSRPTRRAVLAAAGAAGTLALAGCGSKSKRQPDVAGPGSLASTEPPGSAPAPAQPHPIAPVAKVPVGGSLVVTTSQGPVVLARRDAATVVAHTGVCTHMGCTVGAQGAKLVCPCHGSTYDAFTGQVLRGPAPRALAPIAVTVRNGQVVET